MKEYKISKERFDSYVYNSLSYLRMLQGIISSSYDIKKDLDEMQCLLTSFTLYQRDFFQNVKNEAIQNQNYNPRELLNRVFDIEQKKHESIKFNINMSNDIPNILNGPENLERRLKEFMDLLLNYMAFKDKHCVDINIHFGILNKELGRLWLVLEIKELGFSLHNRVLYSDGTYDWILDIRNSGGDISSFVIEQNIIEKSDSKISIQNKDILTKRILIAGNDALDIPLLIIYLKKYRLDAEMDIALDEVNLIDKIKSTKYDLIFLYQYSNIKGVEVSRKLKEKYKVITPTIIIENDLRSCGFFDDELNYFDDSISVSEYPKRLQELLEKYLIK